MRGRVRVLVTRSMSTRRGDRNTDVRCRVREVESGRSVVALSAKSRAKCLATMSQECVQR